MRRSWMPKVTDKTEKDRLATEMFIRRGRGYCDSAADERRFRCRATVIRRSTETLRPGLPPRYAPSQRTACRDPGGRYAGRRCGRVAGNSAVTPMSRSVRGRGSSGTMAGWAPPAFGSSADAGAASRGDRYVDRLTLVNPFVRDHIRPRSGIIRRHPRRSTASLRSTAAIRREPEERRVRAELARPRPHIPGGPNPSGSPVRWPGIVRTGESVFMGPPVETQIRSAAIRTVAATLMWHRQTRRTHQEVRTRRTRTCFPDSLSCSTISPSSAATSSTSASAAESPTHAKAHMVVPHRTVWAFRMSGSLSARRRRRAERSSAATRRRVRSRCSRCTPDRRWRRYSWSTS